MDPLGERVRPGGSGRRSRRSRAQRTAVTVLLALTCLSAHAAEDPPLVEAVPAVARQVVYDAKDLGSAPFRWKRHEWLRFGEGAALVLAAYAADDHIVRFVSRQQNHAGNEYLRAVTHLGGGYGLDLAAVLAVTGYVRGDERMLAAGADALESSVIAAGLITPALKRVAGRARPLLGEGKDAFDPFTAWDSFPSGHATNAFAIYTAIASRYEDNRYVPAIAYTIATSVAVARVHDRVHFASDVIAGGLIGRAVAKSIVGNHRRMKVVIIPTGRGFAADIRF